MLINIYPFPGYRKPLLIQIFKCLVLKCFCFGLSQPFINFTCYLYLSNELIQDKLTVLLFINLKRGTIRKDTVAFGCSTFSHSVLYVSRVEFVHVKGAVFCIE